MNVGMMTRVALMAAVTAVAAQIAIPLPFSPVPVTLQVLAVILSGLLLGPRHGALAQGVYLLIGAAGAPVFSAFRGGLGHILNPTGGYLLSYPLAAAAAGFAAHAAVNDSRQRALTVSFLCGATGLSIIYAGGVVWLSAVTGLPLAAALAQGVLPFVGFDLVKVGMAAAIGVAAAPAIAASRA